MESFLWNICVCARSYAVTGETAEPLMKASHWVQECWGSTDILIKFISVCLSVHARQPAPVNESATITASGVPSHVQKCNYSEWSKASFQPFFSFVRLFRKELSKINAKWKKFLVFVKMIALQCPYVPTTLLASKTCSFSSLFNHQFSANKS